MSRYTSYPLAPLERLLHARSGLPEWRPDRHGEHGAEVWSDRVLADMCGVSLRTAQRWRTQGLTWWMADRAAVACGLHPALIWPTWFDDATTDCGTPPGYKRHRSAQEPPCEPCRLAYNAHQLAQKRARRETAA
jgi:hypothetical protein